MDRYEWQLNKAIVDRCYYSERIVQTTFGFATLGTIFDGYFLSQGYFPEASRRRIPKYWAFAFGVSAISLFVLLKPLTREEKQLQWHKRRVMGKYLSSLYHLDPIAPAQEEQSE